MEIVLFGLTKETYSFNPYEEFNIAKVSLDDTFLKNLCLK